jgi:hypothetical protein
VQRPFRVTVIAPILAGALAVSAIAIAGNLGVQGGLETKNAPKHLRIHGHVLGLLPGQTRTYTVRVRNPLDLGVVVHRVRADVRRGRIGSVRCPKGVLHIRTWKGTRRIPPHDIGTFSMSVRLRRRTPARCVDARWPIHYVARSVRP